MGVVVDKGDESNNDQVDTVGKLVAVADGVSL